MPITKEIQDKLQQRLIDAIKAGFKPCPLIGPKWFKYVGGNEASFQFLGIAKLAKATCGKDRVVARVVVENLKVADLGMVAQVTSDSNIVIRPKASSADKTPAKPAKPKP